MPPNCDASFFAPTNAEENEAKSVLPAAATSTRRPRPFFRLRLPNFDFDLMLLTKPGVTVTPFSANALTISVGRAPGFARKRDRISSLLFTSASPDLLRFLDVLRFAISVSPWVYQRLECFLITKYDPMTLV
jgi:hypothetical protein